MHLRVASVLLHVALGLFFPGLLLLAGEMTGYLHEPPEGSRVITLWGLAVLCVAGFLVVRYLPHVVRGREVVGRVAAVQPATDDRSRVVVVRYVVEGRVFLIEHATLSERLGEGHEVRVLYPRESPKDGCVGHWSHLYLCPLVLVAVGCAFLALGLPGLLR